MNINPIANYSNPYDKYTQKNTANSETNQNINNPVLKDDMLQNDISNTEGEDTKKAKNGGHKSSPEECETCKKRKYQDGSDEANVSFKSASHISPESAASAVRAHEGEHVSNAYKKAAEKDGKVVRASVSIHTSVCPECGRVYVSGGTTDTTIKYGDETNPYQKDKKSLGSVTLRGDNLDYTL